MTAIYIFIILLFRVVQAFYNKRSSNEIQNMTMLVGYNAFQNAISSVLAFILVLAAGADFRIGVTGISIAAFSGITLFFSTFCGIYAMKSGTVSLNSMFATAGMIIPIIAGVFLFDKSVAPMQIAGVGLFFLSALLLIVNSREVYSNFSGKTFLLLIGSMAANGGTMLAQQMYTEYVPDGDVSVFSLLSFGIIAVLSGIFYKGFTVMRKKNKKEEINCFTKQLVVCGIALAFSVFVINQLATISTRLVSPVILFTFINGGGTIISALVAAVVYKEKITRKAAAGIVIGVLSLVIIKLFETA